MFHPIMSGSCPEFIRDGGDSGKGYTTRYSVLNPDLIHPRGLCQIL